MFNKKPDANLNPRRLAEPMPIPTADHRESRAAPRYGSPIRAVIDAGLCIKGDLETEGEIQVDGQVKGDVKCASLTVGRDGAVFGNVTAGEVVVRGKIKGAIRATRVLLLDSANVEGEIAHQKIAIEEGARFLGTSTADSGEPTSQVAQLQQVAADMNAKTG
jgi:cytoskeletal protein CcmA (bactofilin family)